MELKILQAEFSICKIKDIHQVNFMDEFCFVSKTDEELSLVCQIASVPEQTIERDDGWLAFRIQGVLDFSLIGILSKLSAILADHNYKRSVSGWCCLLLPKLPESKINHGLTALHSAVKMGLLRSETCDFYINR